MNDHPKIEAHAKHIIGKFAEALPETGSCSHTAAPAAPSQARATSPTTSFPGR